MSTGNLPPLKTAPSSSQGKRGKRITPVQKEPQVELATLSNEEKLNEQFRFFRREFIECAASSGVTLPLGIADEKTSQVIAFVRNNGPKIMFQIIQSNMGSVHLLRCSLSLLIVTVTVLRRKVNGGGGGGDTGTSNNTQLNTNASIGNTLSQWAQTALAKLADSGAVPVCMSVLIYTFNPSVQELAVNLLSAVTAVSREAATQMTWAPNSVNGCVTSIIPINKEKESTNKSATTNKRPSSSQEFKKYDFKYNDSELVLKKGKKEKKTPTEEQHSCLAYMLSICLLQKNRHLLLAGCADIMLSVLRWDPTPDMHELLASITTCDLPAVDLNSSKNGGGKGGKTKSGSRSADKFTGAPAQVAVAPTNPLANQIIEWAGLKLFLKFLHRHLKVTQFARPDSMPRDEVSASIRLREEFTFAHLKIFTIASALLSGSEVVADYAHELPGVSPLIQMSASVHYPYTAEVEASLRAAVLSLQEANNRKKQKESEQEAAFLAYAQSRRDNTINAGNGNNPNNHNDGNGGASNHRPSNFGKNNGNTNNINNINNNHMDNNNNNNNNNNQYNFFANDGRGANSSGSGSGGGTSGQGQDAFLDAPKPSQSPSKFEQHKEKVNLVSNITVDFKSPVYEVEMEKKKLYLLLSSLDSAHDAAAAAELIYQENKQRSTEPLPSEKDLLTDKPASEFAQSVDIVNDRPTTSGTNGTKTPGASRPTTSGGGYIDPAKLQPLQMRTIAAYSNDAAVRQQEYNNSRSVGMNSNGSAMSRSASRGLHTPHFFKGGRNPNSTSGSEDLNFSGKNLHTLSFIDSRNDFFGKLSSKPALPGRIDPREVIVPDEEMEAIREKFKQVAADAVHHVKDTLGFYHEGKGSIPIAERARRVYSPNRGRSGDGTAGFENSMAGSSNQGLGPATAGGFDNTFNSTTGGPEKSSSAYGEDEFEKPSTVIGDNDEEDAASYGAAGDVGDDSSVEEAKIFGLKLDTTDFDDQTLFDGLKPIFDPPVVAPPDEKDYKKVSNDADEDKDGPPQIGGTGRHVKLNLDVAQAVDLVG